MTVDEMLHRMSSRELAEWMAFSELEPFGGQQEDGRFGVIACLIASIYRGKNSPVPSPGDFFASLKSDKSERHQQTEESMKRVLFRTAKGRKP